LPLPGVSSGINQDGTFAAMLDAKATGRATRPGNLRVFVLSDFLEHARNDLDFAAEAGAIFRTEPILRGSNFLLCGPHAVACVAEYDGNLKKESGVTLRLPPKGQDWIAVTNHFRGRSKPTPSERYTKLEATLTAIASSGQKLATLADGWEIIRHVAQNSTLLTIVYCQSKRVLLVSFTDGSSKASELQPTQFTLEELFANPLTVHEHEVIDRQREP
jgi:hypothetical protein